MPLITTSQQGRAEGGETIKSWCQDPRVIPRGSAVSRGLRAGGVATRSGGPARLEVLDLLLAVAGVCLEEDGADPLLGGPFEDLVLVGTRNAVELDEEDLEATVIDGTL